MAMQPLSAGDGIRHSSVRSGPATTVVSLEAALKGCCNDCNTHSLWHTLQCSWSSWSRLKHLVHSMRWAVLDIHWTGWGRPSGTVPPRHWRCTLAMSWGTTTNVLRTPFLCDEEATRVSNSRCFQPAAPLKATAVVLSPGACTAPTEAQPQGVSQTVWDLRRYHGMHSTRCLQSNRDIWLIKRLGRWPGSTAGCHPCPAGLQLLQLQLIGCGPRWPGQLHQGQQKGCLLCAGTIARILQALV